MRNAPARFNEEKLLWLNAEHIKRAEPGALGRQLERFLLEIGCNVFGGPAPADVAALYRERASTLVEMANAARYLYVERPEISDELRGQHLGESSRALLRPLAPRLATVGWQRETIAALLKSFAAEQGVKMPQVMMPVRVAVSGSVSTPAVDAVLAVLGRERTLERLAAVA